MHTGSTHAENANAMAFEKKKTTCTPALCVANGLASLGVFCAAAADVLAEVILGVVVCKRPVAVGGGVACAPLRE